MKIHDEAFVQPEHWYGTLQGIHTMAVINHFVLDVNVYET